jgi:hypothetical protein
MQNETGTNFNRVNRYGEQMPQSTLPFSMHNEQDPMQDFTNGKILLSPSNRLEPLPVKHTEFLRKRQGNGGSPTNFEVK